MKYGYYLFETSTDLIVTDLRVTQGGSTKSSSVITYSSFRLLAARTHLLALI